MKTTRKYSWKNTTLLLQILFAFQKPKKILEIHREKNELTSLHS